MDFVIKVLNLPIYTTNDDLNLFFTRSDGIICSKIIGFDQQSNS